MHHNVNTSPWMIHLPKLQGRHVLLLLLFLGLSALSIAHASTYQPDVDALLALRSAWLDKPSLWDVKTDPCEEAWTGILCTNYSGVVRVSGLLLSNQDLAGTLSPAIGSLANLTDLDLSSNPNLGGNLPVEIANLTLLNRFFLQFCNFSGSIPDEIGNLTSLEYLGLNQNQFTGSLPESIGYLHNILWLDVSGNKLSGSLPVSTTSSIGVGLDNLTNAEHFHLQSNSFTGSIPSSMFNNDMQLLHLLLNDNQLTGGIPSTIGDLPDVQIICLESNSLNGTIPSTISAIKNLTNLQVNMNELSGDLPDLSSNANLQMLTVGGNPFNATEIPSWITELKNLYLLSMDASNLIGSIPSDVFGFSSNLANVSLASNQLNGTLNLTSASSSLKFVNVTGNDITDVQKGSYSGELLLDENPYCTTTNSNCSITQSTSTSSSTPTSQCTKVCSTDYAINPRASSGCDCVHPVSALCTFYATKVPTLTDFNLADLEEEFVTALKASRYIKNVIPLDDTQAVIDIVSPNQMRLSVFPPNTTSLWSTTQAAILSYVLQNHDVEFPEIGPYSCGIQGSPYPAAVVVNELSTAAKIGIGVGAALMVIIIVVLGIFVFQLRRRAKKAEKLNQPFASWIGGDNPAIPQLKGARWFSLEEISKCTNAFSKSNEIGEGGYGKVYKGHLETGEAVAIKRAGSGSLQGAAEFANEIELLSRVHHRNLVGLIGFCFEEGEQILVYEYMPNGTLRDAIVAGRRSNSNSNSNSSSNSANWERRIELALGSARGLAYLHTEADPPIVHRDIKSSNILLDHKLAARVADFGLSKFVPDAAGDGRLEHVSMQVKGTLGYLDPHYYTTNRFTDKSDVYSFGVVLLELVTGKLPIEGGKYVVREVREAIREARGIAAIMDPDLAQYPIKAAERLVDIALNCVQDDPDRRLSMSEVVKELEALARGDGPRRASSSSLSLEMPDADAVGSGDSKLYGPDSAFARRRDGRASFEYSGSYLGLSKPLEPK